MTTTIQIPELIGHTLTFITHEDDSEIQLHRADGKIVKFYHRQDCCESVFIESIVGDLNDLIGSPILVAEYTTSDEAPEGATAIEEDLWTFYKFATAKGWIDIRWHGSSNGYYSMDVDMDLI